MDFFYGDPRELLSIAEWELVQVPFVSGLFLHSILNHFLITLRAFQIREYCQSNVGDPACVDSPWPFPRGFANYFHPIDIGVQLMGLYGVSGDITVSTVDRSPNSETTGQVLAMWGMNLAKKGKRLWHSMDTHHIMIPICIMCRCSDFFLTFYLIGTAGHKNQFNRFTIWRSHFGACSTILQCTTQNSVFNSISEVHGLLYKPNGYVGWSVLVRNQKIGH